MPCFRPIAAPLLLLFFAQAAQAGTLGPLKPITSTQKQIENVGTGVAIAMPLIAAGISLYKDDRTGLAELTAETILTVGTAYALKNIVREKRPDNSDWHSFPSETTALSASGSSYLWGRYGWRYGLPAFVATQFVSYSRVQAKQHHWYDTLASSAMAAGYGYVITTPFHRWTDIYSEVEASPDGAMIHMSYNF